MPVVLLKIDLDVHAKGRGLVGSAKCLDDAIDRVPHDVYVLDAQVVPATALVVVHILSAAASGVCCHGICSWPGVDDEIRGCGSVNWCATAIVDLLIIEVRGEDCLDDLFVLNTAGLLETREWLSTACDGGMVCPV